MARAALLMHARSQRPHSPRREAHLDTGDIPEEGRRDAKNVPSQQMGTAAPHAPGWSCRRWRSRGNRLRSVSRCASGDGSAFLARQAQTISHRNRTDTATSDGL